jgi:hypothetical protein
MSAAIDRDALRTLVRQVLRDALPAADKPAAGGAAADAQETAIAGDADLNAFARRIAALCEDADTRAAIKAGRVKFRLAKPAARPATATRRREDRVEPHRIERGLVAERHIVAAAQNGRKLTVARGVAVTPLARDKARQLGVVIERE